MSLEPCGTCPYFVPLPGPNQPKPGQPRTGRCHRNPPDLVQIMIPPNPLERNPQPIPAWQGVFPPTVSDGPESGCGEHPTEKSKRTWASPPLPVGEPR